MLDTLYADTATNRQLAATIERVKRIVHSGHAWIAGIIVGRIMAAQDIGVGSLFRGGRGNVRSLPGRPASPPLCRPAHQDVMCSAAWSCAKTPMPFRAHAIF